MKCPECGYEHPNTFRNDGDCYRDSIEKRLAEYGYPKYMTPQKAQAATAIREVIAIRTGVKCKPGGGLSSGELKKALAELDLILPSRKDKEEKQYWVLSVKTKKRLLFRIGHSSRQDCIRM